MTNRGVVRLGDLASCGDAATGGSTITIGGQPVSYVNIDAAGGTIIGPGAQTVTMQDEKPSLRLDAVAGHGPLQHAVPFMIQSSETVFCGTGFVGQGPGESFVEPTTDLELDDFAQIIPTNVNFPTATPPAYVGPLDFVISVLNNGPSPAASVTVGLYELDVIAVADFATTTQIFINQFDLPEGVSLVGTAQTENNLVGLDTVTIDIDEIAIGKGNPRYYAVGIDIYNTQGEINELNLSPILAVAAI